MPINNHTDKIKHTRRDPAAWFSGLLILFGLIILVTHFSEVEHFAQLMRQIKPVWLGLVILLQLMTYISEAAMWYLALDRAGLRQSLISLVPLGFAKLYSDKVLPIGGVGGSAFLIAALQRRGIPAHLCMAVLLLSLVAYYAAYVIAALVTVLLLYFYHALQSWVIMIIIIFCLVAIGIPAGALWIRSVGKKQLPAILLHIPGLKRLLNLIADSPGELLHNRTLVMATILLRGLVFVLDALTLWVILLMIGISVSFWVAFPAFILASIVTSIGPVPMGLGTFEVTCVSMLGVLGVPIEAALTATLMLRGFTLWLPMFPGMWLMRRALHS